MTTKKVTLEDRVKWLENKITDIVGLDGKFDAVAGQFREQNHVLDNLKSDIMKVGQGVVKDALNLHEFMSSMSERLEHDDKRDNLIYERLGKLESFQNVTEGYLYSEDKDVDAHLQSHEKWSDEILKLRERVGKFEDHIMAPPSDISILADRIGRLEKAFMTPKEEPAIEPSRIDDKCEVCGYRGSHVCDKCSEMGLGENSYYQPLNNAMMRACKDCKHIGPTPFSCRYLHSCNNHNLFKPKDDDPTKEELKRDIARTLSRISTDKLFEELCNRSDVRILPYDPPGTTFIIDFSKRR